MKDDNLQVGSLVMSTYGRDKGKVYMILQRSNKQYMRLVDGDTKKLVNAKLKNTKHVRPLNLKLEKIQEKILNNIKIFDSEIYSAIKKAVENILKED